MDATSSFAGAADGNPPVGGLRLVDDGTGASHHHRGSSASDHESQQRFVDNKYMRLRHLTAELRGRDIATARALEEKMRLMGDMLVVLGSKDPLRDNPPDYVSLVRPEKPQQVRRDFSQA